MTCSMFLDFRLSEKLWTETISHSNWLRNVLPSARTNIEIPISAWIRISSDLFAFLVFETKGNIFQHATSEKRFAKDAIWPLRWHGKFLQFAQNICAIN